MIQFAKSERSALAGQLLYRANEYSFDFEFESKDEALFRAGDKGTTSLLVGTLQIEIGIETGAALYVWGLHSHLRFYRTCDSGP
jgi:hypothetical protein